MDYRQTAVAICNTCNSIHVYITTDGIKAFGDICGIYTEDYQCAGQLGSVNPTSDNSTKLAEALLDLSNAFKAIALVSL